MEPRFCHRKRSPGGPSAGRAWVWRWTVLLPAVQRGRAVVSARPCRGRGAGSVGHLRPAGVRQPRPQSTRPDRRCPGGRADLSRNPSRGPRNRTPRQRPLYVRDCGRMLAGRPLPPRTRPRLPLSRTGTRRSQAADRPSTPRRLRQQWTQAAAAVSTAAAAPRRGRLSGRGCPPHGMLPQQADTAAVSAAVPELRPPGDAVRTAGVHRGQHRLRGVCCYRKRSPDRWPLVWCRHRRYARASCRCNRSPSWART
jgi:hypothetical protein